MTYEDYTATFAVWNLIFSAVCPRANGDMLVYRVENDMDFPNIVIHASLCDGPVPLPGTLIGEPIVKVIARDAILPAVRKYLKVEEAA